MVMQTPMPRPTATTISSEMAGVRRSESSASLK